MGASRSGILLGNSRMRYGHFEGILVNDSKALAYEEFETVGNQERFEDFFGEGKAEVVVGSVCDDRLAELRKQFEMVTGTNPAEPGRFLEAGRDFEIPIENLYENPGEAGVDRLLNALAASTRWPAEAVIVADFGTALSFSVVSTRGEFLGGPIGAGVRTALCGLSAATPGLPELEDGSATPLIARSTAQALRAGILGQARSGVSGLVRGIQAELGANARVVATGGEAELVASGLDLFDSIEPELTLEGLAIAAETGARP